MSVSTRWIPLPKNSAKRRRFHVVPALACAWLILVTLLMIFAPVIAPEGYNVQDVQIAFQGPSLAHPLGTDELGRDLFVRLIYGATPALVGAALTVVISTIIGTAAGLAGGYRQGGLDRTLAMTADVLQSIPALLVLLVVFAIFPGNVYLTMSVMGVLLFPPTYRIVRGATLAITNELYVTAALASGLSHLSILWRHLAPRLKTLVRVQASITAAVALAMEAGLGFLGLDVVPPQPSWGGILADASHYLFNDPWMIVPPLVTVCLTTIAFGLLGDTPSAARRRRRLRTPVAPEQVAEGSAQNGTALSAKSRGDALLSVSDLTVRTSGKNPQTLVEGVSFDVRPGEIVGLVGESGAGKSVSARALIGLDDDVTVSGSVVFDGRELLSVGLREINKVRGDKIAYVGQEPMTALDPLFTVENQLVEAIQNHRALGKTAARAEARRLLSAVKIPDPEAVIRKRPFELSGGMAQRVAIAVALAGEPEMIIADEPTTALDVTVQMEVLGLLKTLQRERGLAILLVTHDWGVVADMCDRTMTFYAGELVESGRTDDVFAVPSHPYTAALRQSDPHLQSVGARLRTIPGTVPPPGSWPTHCRFADRCPLVLPACREAHPDLIQLPGDHTSRCIRADELHAGVVHV